MTYQFFRRFFNARIASWVTAFWFALLLMIMFMLSSYDEELFLYLDF